MSSQLTEIRRLRQQTETQFAFKKRGNEEQFKINRKVLERIDEASEAMELAAAYGEQVGVAITCLAEGRSTLEQRNKLIKLADKSEVGWKLVDEYVANDLTENSDDEKRIFKSEARATKKIKESRQKKQGFFSSRDSRWSPHGLPASSSASASQADVAQAV